MIHRAYKYRIYPTVVQREQLERDFNAARWAWNTALWSRRLAWDYWRRSHTYVEFPVAERP